MRTENRNPAKQINDPLEDGDLAADIMPNNSVVKYTYFSERVPQEGEPSTSRVETQHEEIVRRLTAIESKLGI